MTHHLIWLCLLCRWNRIESLVAKDGVQWALGGHCPCAQLPTLCDCGTEWIVALLPIVQVDDWHIQVLFMDTAMRIQYTAMYTVYSYGWANQFFIFSIGICRLTLGCPIDFFLFTQLAMMSDLCSIFLNWHSICILQTHELDWSQSVKRQIDSILYLYKRHSPTIC